MSENTITMYTRMPSDFTLEDCVTALTHALLYDMGGGGRLFRLPDEAENGANVSITFTVDVYEAPVHEHLKDAE